MQQYFDVAYHLTTTKNTFFLSACGQINSNVACSSISPCACKIWIQLLKLMLYYSSLINMIHNSFLSIFCSNFKSNQKNTLISSCVCIVCLFALKSVLPYFKNLFIFSSRPWLCCASPLIRSQECVHSCFMLFMRLATRIINSGW